MRLLMLAAAAMLLTAAASPPIAQAAALPLCGHGKRVSCVVDGDTFWLRGEKVRIANIDAPEQSEPRCAAEAQLAHKATARLQALLNAGVPALTRAGKDRYGRTLATVSVNGADVGRSLAAAGLARIWDGARHPWC